MAKLFGLLWVLMTPFFIGLPWAQQGGAGDKLSCLCFVYVAGYFLRLTLFHLVAMPMTVLGMRFSTMSNVFTVLLALVSILSVWQGRSSLVLFKGKNRKPGGCELLYGFVFLSLLLFQVYMALYMDPTIMTYDDAFYTVIGNDALATDHMFITSPYSGLYKPLDYRFIQSDLLFPAYISRMTGMPISVVERMFNYAMNVLLAYCCYVYMGEDLYNKRENMYIFLIFISVIYIFGYHSHYSMTFRLLGPNSQGKAVLAVTLVPMLFVLFRKKMGKDYNWRFGLFLFFLSDAACALSLMGSCYFVTIVVLMGLLSVFSKRKQMKKLLYIPWGCTMPCVYAGAYLIIKYYA